MLVLFESAVGYALFKLTDEKKLVKTEKLFKAFQEGKASKLLTLEHFEKFGDATEALSATTAVIEGKMSKKLKKMLKKIASKDDDLQLAVADPKLGTAIKDKLAISCVSTSAIQDMMSCIRSQIQTLIPEWSPEEEAAMQLGLSHGLGRYKLKFSPDKVDTMIIQAVSLLDDLDKELNNYVMRCKEWYGWHFPELAKIISDNTAYIRTIMTIGMRTNAVKSDLSEVLPEELEAKVKEMAEVSMGTEISEEDLLNINHLATNVLDLQEYRTQLFEYLKNRMMAIAPNLTILVGELVGARLISHAGSLLNLAKHPASTVQILGAEKALFRALKTKHDTPKYGLIYHAQLIGQSNPKLKGKMSRMLAAKSALACRVDALGESTSTELGVEHRAKLESRLKFLEEGGVRRISGTGKGKARAEKYEHKSQLHQYKAAADSTMAPSPNKKKKFDKEVKPEEAVEEAAEVELQEEEVDEAGPAIFSSEKKKKKKRKHADDE
ncbi:Nucleolar protein 58 [Halotydeus destructor]|nr:Nucleolar protein 58 [Halotydeus destructor]